VTVGDLDEVSSAVEIVASAASMDAVIRPPGSKSITNRALLVAALARGESTLTDALYSDDTLVMAEALSSLGMRVETDAEERTFTVTGCDGKPAPGPALSVWGMRAPLPASFRRSSRLAAAPMTLTAARVCGNDRSRRLSGHFKRSGSL